MNGVRISGFSEVRDLPPEAIARVEILPEQVALKYGYSASQRVVNIVLLPHFRVQSGELEDQVATDTHRNDFNTEYQLIRIDPKGRLTLDLQYQTGAPLLESAFGIRTSPSYLTSIDARSVNFARDVQRELRSGVSYSKAAKSNAPRMPGGGTFGGGHYFGTGGTSFNLSLYHTWRFVDRVTVRDGLPVLDLLNASEVANVGGVPRHEVELQVSGTQHGIGFRSNFTWQSATSVRDAATSAASVLHFSSRAKLNARIFYFPALRAHLPASSWLTGVRILFVIDNVLDARIRVRDGTGATPLSYQPGYVDSLGRTLRLSIRKSF